MNQDIRLLQRKSSKILLKDTKVKNRPISLSKWNEDDFVLLLVIIEAKVGM